jgi:hypothetical protein
MLLLKARLPYSIRHDKVICEAHYCGTCATFSRAYRSSLALQYARRFRQPFPGLRGGTGLQRRPSSSRGNLHRTVNKLEADPLTTTVRDPATGEDLEVVLNGGTVVDWLRNQNYGVPTRRAAPDRIDGLAAGRPRPSRRSPWIGQVGRRHPVRTSLPSATGWRMTSHIANSTRSRRRTISPQPAGKRCRNRNRLCSEPSHFKKLCFSVLGVGSLGPPYILTMSRQGSQTCHVGVLYSSRFSS